MSGDFDAEDLRAFAMIAMSGGLSAAARRFDRPKATLSRSLSRLEDAAGAPLFDRLSKGLQLTPAGELLRDAAGLSFDAVNDAEEVLRRAGGEPRGPLRIAGSAVTGQALLAPAIAELVRIHPKVEPCLYVCDSGTDPVAHGFDVVLRVGRPEEPHLVARRIASAVTGIYASGAARDRIDGDDPGRVEALGRVVIEAAGVPDVWTLRNGDDTLELKSAPFITVNDPLLALAVLATGKGITYLPDVYAKALTERGTLHRVLAKWEGPPIELYASLPPRRTLVPAVRAFLSILKERVQAVMKTGFVD